MIGWSFIKGTIILTAWPLARTRMTATHGLSFSVNIFSSTNQATNSLSLLLLLTKYITFILHNCSTQNARHSVRYLCYKLTVNCILWTSFINWTKLGKVSSTCYGEKLEVLFSEFNKICRAIICSIVRIVGKNPPYAE